MRVRVDADLCQGHARCWAICPEVFQLDEAGYATAAEDEVPADLEDAVREAAAVCPERAIALDG